MIYGLPLGGQGYSEARNGMPLSDLDENNILIWLNLPSLRDQRRFLEAHPELLSPEADALLEAMIFMKGQSLTVQVRDSYNHLSLLQEIRVCGGTIMAIHEGYVNKYGELVLDIPAWLEEVELQLSELEFQLRSWQSVISEQVEKRQVELLLLVIERVRAYALYAPLAIRIAR